MHLRVAAEYVWIAETGCWRQSGPPPTKWSDRTAYVYRQLQEVTDNAEN